MNIIFNLLNNLLNYMFSITGDWGIAIILLTICVKLILLPISIKQKKSLIKQQSISKELEEIKNKYSKDKEKLNEELQKHYSQNAKSMFGCLVGFLQLPIISSLYFVIMKMPVAVGTILVPWICNIKLADSYFILPLIYAFVSIWPSLLSYIPFLNYLKGNTQTQGAKNTIILNIIMGLLITFKAPIAISIYFITSSLFSFIEELVYRICMRNKAFCS